MTLPATLNAAIKKSVAHLEKQLRCSSEDAASHRVVTLEGWHDDDATLNATAVYLVGLMATAISKTLRVRACITDTKEDRLELVRNVEKRVGTVKAPLSKHKKREERNPWLAEGLWHLCLFLAARRSEFHPVGTIVALDHPHVSPKDHGFDVIALYYTGSEFGVSIVESKAYEKRPKQAVTHAIKFFRSIDAGGLDERLRQVVSQMRDALPPRKQRDISPSLWKHRRTYIPNPHYDSSNPVSWSKERRSFAKLRVPKEHIFIMPNALPNFGNFFDALSAEMLRFAKKIENV